MAVTPRPATNPAPAEQRHRRGHQRDAVLDRRHRRHQPRRLLRHHQPPAPPRQPDRHDVQSGRAEPAARRTSGASTSATPPASPPAPSGASPPGRRRPAAATNPNPANLATGVAINATLAWTAGAGARARRLLRDHQPATFRGNQTGTTFNPARWPPTRRTSGASTSGTPRASPPAPSGASPPARLVAGRGDEPEPGEHRDRRGHQRDAVLDRRIGADLARRVLRHQQPAPLRAATRPARRSIPARWPPTRRTSGASTSATPPASPPARSGASPPPAALPGAAANPNPANAPPAWPQRDAVLDRRSGATSRATCSSAPPTRRPSRGNQTGTTFNPGALTANTTYFWRIDERNTAGVRTGTVWSFTTAGGTLPGAASNPEPGERRDRRGHAARRCPGPPGRVPPATTCSSAPAVRPRRAPTRPARASPGALAADTTYFWRIDERNAAGVTTGTVWSFTTTDPLLPLTLQNGWTNAPFATNDAGVIAVSDKIYLRGAINTTGTNPVAFTLPFGPNADVYVPITLCDASKGRLHIQPDGTTRAGRGRHLGERPVLHVARRCVVRKVGVGLHRADAPEWMDQCPVRHPRRGVQQHQRRHPPPGRHRRRHHERAVHDSGRVPSVDRRVRSGGSVRRHEGSPLDPSRAARSPSTRSGPSPTLSVSCRSKAQSYALTSSGYNVADAPERMGQRPFATRNAAVRNSGGIVRLPGARSTPAATRPCSPCPRPPGRPRTCYIPVDLCSAQKGRIMQSSRAARSGFRPSPAASPPPSASRRWRGASFGL